MGGLASGHSELIRLSAVDYITGTTIIDSLVRPTNRVVDWRTRYSGVSYADMVRAEKKGEALNGWREARQELWRYINANTILIGHAMQNDLDALHLIHTNVVDSDILVGQATSVGTRRRWGLKQLCRELPEMQVQCGGKRGHCCLEDALAAREVVIWCGREPEALGAWGEVKKEEERLKREAERLKREEEARNRRKEQRLEGFDGGE